MPTFEQLYEPIVAVRDAAQAKNCFEQLVKLTLTRSAWEDTPSNRERAIDLLREEIEFISQYETEAKANQIRRFFLQNVPILGSE